MKKAIAITLLCLMLVPLLFGCVTHKSTQEPIYAVIQGKFVGNSPQLVDDHYAVFLWGVPDEFTTILFPEDHMVVYDHALFGEVNTFYLVLINDRWVVTSVTNGNGSVGYLGW